jgi:hypothetical protein
MIIEPASKTPASFRLMPGSSASATVGFEWRSEIAGAGAASVRAMADDPRSRFLRIPLTPFLLSVLIGVRVVGLGIEIHDLKTRPVTDEDIGRFEQIVKSYGRPYRDFPVEYAPGELILIEAIGRTTSPEDLGIKVAVLSFACDLAAAGALAYGWGRRSATVYLLLSSALMGFMFLRIDYVPVALAAWALALIKRGRGALGGTFLGLAVLIKLWPLVLLPILVLWKRAAALAWACAIAAAGFAGWLFYGGLSGPNQVFTMRGAPGWQIESTVGVLVWILTGGPISFVLNADRVGTSSQPERWALSLAVAVAVAAVWWGAMRRPARDPAGGAALSAVACVLIFSPVFSLQYVAWLLPWGAIAHQDEPNGPAWMLGPIVILSAVLNYFYTYGGSLGLFQVTALMRDGFCVALVVWWFARSAREVRSGRDERGPATLRV